MPNLNPSSLNCICPVFTNNLSRSNQLFYITNIHTCVSVCIQQCTDNIRRTSRKGQSSLVSTVTIPFQTYDGNQLVRNKHPTLPSPQRCNSRK